MNNCDVARPELYQDNVTPSTLAIPAASRASHSARPIPLKRRHSYDKIRQTFQMASPVIHLSSSVNRKDPETLRLSDGATERKPSSQESRRELGYRPLLRQIRERGRFPPFVFSSFDQFLALLDLKLPKARSHHDHV